MLLPGRMGLNKKEWEIEGLHNELEIEEFKKQKRAHIKEIVETSFLSEEEKEWLREGFAYNSPTVPSQTTDPNNM